MRSLMLLLLGAAVVARAQEIPAIQTQAAPEVGRYLDPLSLAQQYVNNVFTVSERCSREVGYALAIGASDDAVYLATPSHVVAAGDCARYPDVTVTNCVTKAPRTAAVQLIHPKLDLAILEVGVPPPDTLVHEIAATKFESTGLLRSIGFESGCDVANLGALLREREDRFLVDGEIAGGMSGVPLADGRGIQGIALRSLSQGRTEVLKIDVIRAWSREQGIDSNLLGDSDNLPPGSADAVRRQYVEVLGGLLYNQEQIHDFFDKGWIEPNNLLQIIPPYNDAFRVFSSQQQLIVPSIEAFWPKLGEETAEVIKLAWAAHEGVRDLNDDVNSIARTGKPTLQMKRRLAALGPAVDEFQTAYVQLKEKIDAP